MFLCHKLIRWFVSRYRVCLCTTNWFVFSLSRYRVCPCATNWFVGLYHDTESVFVLPTACVSEGENSDPTVYTVIRFCLAMDFVFHCRFLESYKNFAVRTLYIGPPTLSLSMSILPSEFSVQISTRWNVWQSHSWPCTYHVLLTYICTWQLRL